jgi:hypothetical protein
VPREPAPIMRMRGGVLKFWKGGAVRKEGGSEAEVGGARGVGVVVVVVVVVVMFLVILRLLVEMIGVFVLEME